MGKKLITVLLMIFIFLSDATAFQEKGCIINGKITDTAGNPLPGTIIKIENTFLGEYSNSDGTYSFNHLKKGDYSLQFSFLGYETQVHKITLIDSAILNISLLPKELLTDEVIINATRAGSHSPLAYSTTDNEMLRKLISGQDIPFMLSLTPSLVETSEAGNGIGYTSLRIRGTDANRINVTIDGIPLNDPESQQVFWVDFPDLASSVDNIQVQRGAGTSSNGAGAFGATISIQTKNPDNEPFAQISSSLGSFNTIKNSIAAGTGILAGKFAFQVRLSHLKSDGYIDRTGSDHSSAYISGVFKTGRSRFKANIILGKERTGIGWWGVPEDMLSVDRRYNPAGEYTDENGITRYYANESDNYIQNHYQLIFSHEINNNLSFNTALHYTMGKGYYEEFKEDKSLSGYGLPELKIGDTAIYSSDMITRKWMSNDFYGFVYSLKYSKNRINVIIGGGLNYYSGDHFGKIIWMMYPGNLDKDHQWYLNSGTKSEISLYDKIDYSITDKLSVFGDLQYRYIFYKMSGEDDDLKDLGQRHTYNFFNPKAGIFYAISSSQNAYLSFSVANREPSRADFKEAAGDVNATPKPETLYDAELGYKLNKEKYSLAVNLYGMFYKDQLVPTGQLSSTGYSIMTNVGESHRLGIELITGLKPVDFIEWNISATFSRNKILDFTEYYIDYGIDWFPEYKSKNLGTVNIAYSPSVITTSDLNFKILKILEMHLISKYVGSQYFDNTMSSERKIDPYFINNIRIDFEPVMPKIKGTEFQILFNNIFNVKYESNAYGGNWYEAGVEKTWAYYFPQAGFNFMFRASIMF